ncbi:electron transfer flavoprotein subunit alpha/FixB family protein [Chania multitudinisentens]|uniref:electron transfer flavoprotein subunit alpha/FixB family protein n=1 Tax=Chania multitudinisentens TaxID=1639108 RepID=UPI0004659578|nr:FAD-binding protein [Chania multitudinisentens]
MNIALIMDADAPDFYSHAYSINQFLKKSELTSLRMELWLFSQQAPQHQPQLAGEIAHIRWADVPRLTETRLAVLEQMHQVFMPQMLLFAGNEGGELATRLACRIAGAACCHVEQIRIDGEECWVHKGVYGNHLSAELALGKAPWCLGVARCGARRLEPGSAPLFAERFIPARIPDAEWLLATECIPQAVEPLLNQARYVLAVGEGAGSARQVAHLQQWAASQGAELAASRPVVMNAWCGMERLLGMSGAMIAPEVCIAAGVSGAPAFAIGIRHSRFIVAINSDPQAAIFAQADVGIVGDMHDVLNELANVLQPKRNSTP